VFISQSVASHLVVHFTYIRTNKLLGGMKILNHFSCYLVNGLSQLIKFYLLHKIKMVGFKILFCSCYYVSLFNIEIIVYVWRKKM